MKKITIVLLVLCAVALSALTSVEYVTDTQVKKYANSFVDTYNWQNWNQVSLNMMSGWDLAETVCPFDTSKDFEDYLEKDYRKWVIGVALSNRKTVINWISEDRINDFLSEINNAAVQKKMSLAGRDSLFKKINHSMNYYVSVLKKLQLATAEQRTQVFTEVAKISPRNKAYYLQFSLGRTDEIYDTNLVASHAKLQKLLSQIGIVLAKRCDDFHGYEFTRYSKQYDYLFSLLRWATYLDEGEVMRNEIIGWKEPTIKSLVDDGLVLVTKVKKVTNNYKPS